MNIDCFAYKPLFIGYRSLTFQLSEHTKAIMTKKVQYMSSGHFTTEVAMNLSRNMENENVIDLSKTKTVTDAGRASVIVIASRAVIDSSGDVSQGSGDGG